MTAVELPFGVEREVVGGRSTRQRPRRAAVDLPERHPKVGKKRLPARAHAIELDLRSRDHALEKNRPVVLTKYQLGPRASSHRSHPRFHKPQLLQPSDPFGNVEVVSCHRCPRCDAGPTGVGEQR